MSSQAADNTEPAPPSKRRRVGLACNACRLRKSRCDGQRPKCSACQSLVLECQYEPSESATNIVVRKEYVSDLEQRVTAVESQLQRLNDVVQGHLSPCVNSHNNNDHCLPSDTPQPLGPPGPVAQTGETRAIGLEEPRDEDASTNGMAMTFAEEHTSAFFGESSNINFTQLLLRAVAAVHRATPAVATMIDAELNVGDANAARILQSQPQPIPALSGPSYPSITALPSTDEMDNLLNKYFDTAGVVFPFIHEETMRNTYAECKLNGFKKARRTWLGTLNMIFATASTLDSDRVTSAKERSCRSNVFYHRAIGLCGELSKRVISLEIVHYLLLVVIHCQGSQRSVQAWNNHGLVIRSAMALGLHSTPVKSTIDPIQKKYRQRTWVVIYCLDKVLSAAFGRPAGVADNQVVMRGSPWERSSTASDPSHHNVDIPGEFLAVSYHLYQVMSSSLAIQYAANFEESGLDQDDMASLKASGELRNRLRGWVASLPLTLQLCTPGSDMLSENTQVNRLRVILTLRYHNLGILIHKPLLSATISQIFTKESAPGLPYLTQLAMAEAHECMRSAETTINIVHAIITVDPTSRNNLGVGFFTLYYVFTASLVIVASLLWAQHGGNSADEAAVRHARFLLDKVEVVFQKLDHENSLILNCLEYIRKLARMCSFKGTLADAYGAQTDNGTAGADAAWSGNLESAGTMPLNPDDMEAFQLFSAEMFDPIIFDGMNQSPWDGTGSTNVLWEGFQQGSCG